MKDKLQEGGNLSLDGSEGVKSATKLSVIDLGAQGFEDFKTLFLDFLLELNKAYEKFSGRRIWENQTELANGDYFSGSTRPFFQKSFEEYSARKPKVGDFDLQVPEELLTGENNLKDWLLEQAGKKFGEFTIYGCNFNIDQSHALIRCDEVFPNVGAEFIQLDFEYVQFENSKPSSFAKFAHYSSWEDLESGIKGVFNKFLIQSIVGCIDKRSVILLTPTGKIANNVKSRQDLLAFRSFSVQKGIRFRYKPVYEEDGITIKTINGKECWKELKTKDSVYNTNVDSYFEIIFDRPPVPGEEKTLYSYVRILRTMKHEFTDEKILEVFDSFAKKCYGSDHNEGQVLSAFSIEEDRSWKKAAFEKFYEILPVTKTRKAEVDAKEVDYYSDKQDRERDFKSSNHKGQ